MKWAKERDLVAQTMAFVQSVTGKKPEAEASIEVTSVDKLEKVERPVAIMPMARPLSSSQGQFREEVQGRVAAFRAHQQLFNREREEYFNSVLTKIRATTGSQPKVRGN